jgi:hypothetical protein
MVVQGSATNAFEAHLQALTTSLDQQVNLVRSALDLHPAAPLVDFRKAAEEAIGKFNVAVGDLRSNLTAVASAGGSGELCRGNSAELVAPAVGAEARPGSAYLSSPTMAASIGTPTPGGPERAHLSYQRNADSKRSNNSAEEATWRVLDEAQLEGQVRRSVDADSACSAVSPTPPQGTGAALDDSPVYRQDSEVVADSDRMPGLGLTWRSDPSVTYMQAVHTASMRKAKKKQKCIDGVLNPDWPARLAWDLVVIFLVMCDSVVIPLQLAELKVFNETFDEAWLWFTVTVFGSDVVMNFFTAYHAGKKDAPIQEGTLVTDKLSIAINYLRGWFCIDFLSTVPWPSIADAATSEGSSSSASQVTKLAKVIKLTRLLRLMRMLRLCKLAVIWERVESQIGSISALNVVSMLKVLGIWTAICHWGACVWWMVGRRDSLVMLVLDNPEDLHWTELPRRHSAYDDIGQWAWVDKPAKEQYVFCFYWILGVMRTMPAEVTPVNLMERVFVLFFMFFAVMAFAVNVARMTQAWFKFSARKDAFKEEMAFVRMHLQSVNCDISLQERTKAYLNHLFDKRKIHAKEVSLLSALPDGLKRKLNQAHRLRFLRMVPRLEDWIEPVLKRVCDATDVLDFLPGDKIAEKDQAADAAFVLMRGGLQLFDTVSTRKSRPSTLWRLSLFSAGRAPTTQALTVVDDQCLFELGEKALCKNTVVALECSEVLRIDRQTFQEIMQMKADRNSKAHGNDRRDGESIRSRTDGTIRTNPTVISSHGRAASTWDDDDNDSFGGDLNDGKQQMQEAGTKRPPQKMFGMHMVRSGTMGFGALVAGQSAVS